MNTNIVIDPSLQVPIYKQIIQVIQHKVDVGEYSTGDYLPSMNELANELQISKETVKKAYSILREKRVIESVHGKGFYVTNENSKIKILLLFDKISTYKQVLYDSFVSKIGDSAEITIRLHNQDIFLFEQFIDENLDMFDYYIVTPHFPLNADIQKKVLDILRKIPKRKLLLLDRYIEKLRGNFGSIYQDFENDIFDGLSANAQLFNNCKKLNVFSTPGSLYAPWIEKGIKRFCKLNRVNYEIIKTIDVNKIQKQEIFIILNSQLDTELIELVRIAKSKNYKIGKDIAIISYNESPINEIVLNGLTVFSTDFQQMGEMAGQMIIDKSFRKIRCDFHLIRRNTF